MYLRCTYGVATIYQCCTYHITTVYLWYIYSEPLVYLQSTHSGPAVYPSEPTCIEQTEDIDDRLQSRDPDMTLLVIGQLHQFRQYCTLCGLQSTVFKHTYNLLKA